MAATDAEVEPGDALGAGGAGAFGAAGEAAGGDVDGAGEPAAAGDGFLAGGEPAFPGDGFGFPPDGAAVPAGTTAGW